MFTATDYDKLQQIMDESPDKKELLQKLLDSHRMSLRMVSHEVRNPLTLVYSTLQLMECQHPEITSYAHWTSLREDVEYMKVLLEDLSAFHNGEQLSLSDFDAGTFLKSIVISFAASIADSPIQFTSQIASKLPVITGDIVKLREVLLNLLRNASEAVGSNGIITLQAGVKNDFINIEIQDNGCGIPEEKIETIFEPFVTYKQGGTGLGLAIARQIMRAHNGQLTVISLENVSTTFTLSFPVKQNSQQKA